MKRSLDDFHLLCSAFFDQKLSAFGFFLADQISEDFFRSRAYEKKRGGDTPLYVEIFLSADMRDLPLEICVALGEGKRTFPDSDWETQRKVLVMSNPKQSDASPSLDGAIVFLIVPVMFGFWFVAKEPHADLSWTMALLTGLFNLALILCLLARLRITLLLSIIQPAILLPILLIAGIHALTANSSVTIYDENQANLSHFYELLYFFFLTSAVPVGFTWAGKKYLTRLWDLKSLPSWLRSGFWNFLPKQPIAYILILLGLAVLATAPWFRTFFPHSSPRLGPVYPYVMFGITLIARGWFLKYGNKD